jgi:hypothetical protein
VDHEDVLHWGGRTSLDVILVDVEPGAPVMKAAVQNQIIEDRDDNHKGDYLAATLTLVDHNIDHNKSYLANNNHFINFTLSDSTNPRKPKLNSTEYRPCRT